MLWMSMLMHWKLLVDRLLGCHHLKRRHNPHLALSWISIIDRLCWHQYSQFSFEHTMSSNMPKSIGWIGLGTMGLPMARNLLRKLPVDTQFHVYDVSNECMTSFTSADSTRLHACENSADVARNAVCLARQIWPATSC